ncbi:tetratricopeptide repeat protein [Bauldia sp.]|uniref:tetratricopeptide repeat protein n=1 Tax=Bauldia sp. TaxID=2575872 RepID=UPI003BA85C52
MPASAGEDYGRPTIRHQSIQSHMTGVALLLAGLLTSNVVLGQPEDLATDKAECENGVTVACFNTGVRYSKGLGVEQDEARALPFFVKACNGGNASGCALAAGRYADGVGTDKDEERATAFYVKACEANYAPSCALAGYRYDFAIGVAPDEVRATKLYAAACVGNVALGCQQLGERYHAGRGGVPRDPVRALDLFIKSCDGDLEIGCYSAARATMAAGREDDLENALFYLKRACELEHQPSCDILEEFKALGHGDWVPQ